MNIDPNKHLTQEEFQLLQSVSEGHGEITQKIAEIAKKTLKDLHLVKRVGNTDPMLSKEDLKQAAKYIRMIAAEGVAWENTKKTSSAIKNLFRGAVSSPHQILRVLDSDQNRKIRARQKKEEASRAPSVKLTSSNQLNTLILEIKEGYNPLQNHHKTIRQLTEIRNDIASRLTKEELPEEHMTIQMIDRILTGLDFTKEDFERLSWLVKDPPIITKETVLLTKKLLAYLALDSKDRLQEQLDENALFALKKQVDAAAKKGLEWDCITKTLSAVWNSLQGERMVSSAQQLQEELTLKRYPLPPIHLDVISDLADEEADFALSPFQREEQILDEINAGESTEETVERIKLLIPRLLEARKSANSSLIRQINNHLKQLILHLVEEITNPQKITEVSIAILEELYQYEELISDFTEELIHALQIQEEFGTADFISRNHAVALLKTMSTKIEGKFPSLPALGSLKLTLTALNFSIVEYRELEQLLKSENPITPQTVDLTRKLFKYLQLPRERRLACNNKIDFGALATLLIKVISSAKKSAHLDSLLHALYHQKHQLLPALRYIQEKTSHFSISKGEALEQLNELSQVVTMLLEINTEDNDLIQIASDIKALIKKVSPQIDLEAEEEPTDEEILKEIEEHIDGLAEDLQITLGINSSGFLYHPTTTAPPELNAHNKAAYKKAITELSECLEDIEDIESKNSPEISKTTLRLIKQKIHALTAYLTKLLSLAAGSEVESKPTDEEILQRIQERVDNLAEDLHLKLIPGMSADEEISYDFTQSPLKLSKEATAARENNMEELEALLDKLENLEITENHALKITKLKIRAIYRSIIESLQPSIALQTVTTMPLRFGFTEKVQVSGDITYEKDPGRTNPEKPSMGSKIMIEAAIKTTRMQIDGYSKKSYVEPYQNLIRREKRLEALLVAVNKELENIQLARAAKKRVHFNERTQIQLLDIHNPESKKTITVPTHTEDRTSAMQKAFTRDKDAFKVDPTMGVSVKDHVKKSAPSWDSSKLGTALMFEALEDHINITLEQFINAAKLPLIFKAQEFIFTGSAEDDVSWVISELRALMNEGNTNPQQLALALKQRITQNNVKVESINKEIFADLTKIKGKIEKDLPDQSLKNDKYIPRNLRNAPEFIEAYRSFENGTWQDRDEKQISFTYLEEDDLTKFTQEEGIIDQFFQDEEVLQNLQKIHY